MEERVIVDSRFSAVINAALERIDISVRCVSLPDQEYQECSPTHFAAGSATARANLHPTANLARWREALACAT